MEAAGPNVVKIYIALEEMALPTRATRSRFKASSSTTALLRLIERQGEVIVIPRGTGGQTVYCFESGAILRNWRRRPGNCCLRMPRRSTTRSNG